MKKAVKIIYKDSEIFWVKYSLDWKSVTSIRYNLFIKACIYKDKNRWGKYKKFGSILIHHPQNYYPDHKKASNPYHFSLHTLQKNIGQDKIVEEITNFLDNNFQIMLIKCSDSIRSIYES